MIIAITKRDGRFYFHPDGEPNHAGDGFTGPGKATYAALLWADDQGIQIEAMTGMADKAVCRENLIPFKDTRKKRESNTSAERSSAVHRLWTDVTTGKIQQGEFERRVKEIIRRWPMRDPD